MSRPARILIIAGSDSGGGAGIQADIKTVTMMGGFAMTAVTAITAQNTLGVTGVHAVPPAMVVAQIEAVAGDLGVDAIKIGMIGAADTVAAVADCLEALPSVPVVFDPVMVATSGAVLADADTVAGFERLMRIATVVTPNLPELAALTGRPVDNGATAEDAARMLAARHGCAVLAKGGHEAAADVTDRLVRADGTVTRWTSPRIDSRHTHGTGCTLASGIATGLGQGRPLAEAIGDARAFVQAAIRAAPGFGAGHGPMDHGFRLRGGSGPA
jgi:hydroxymethylpyrimidine/phosphomethylpyrimidine kinase